MDALAKSYETNDCLYIETKAYRESKELLEDTNWVTVLGKPGDGKSAMAAHLMLQYRNKGYEPLFLSSAQDWKLLVSGSSTKSMNMKQFVVIDDIFGPSVVDWGKVHEWLSLIGNMERIVKERNGNLLVVCTSRRYMFSDVESTLSKFNTFKKSRIIDMTDEVYRLSLEEKMKIFERFAVKYDVQYKCSKDEMMHTDPPHGFPHCVEMFCTNAFLQRFGLLFFKNPVACIQNEMYNFKEHDRTKFLALLLVLLNGNHLTTDYFDDISGDQRKLFQSTGVSLDTSVPDLKKALEALENTYLKQLPDHYYCFAHESLMENMASILTYEHWHLAVELLDFKYLLSTLQRSKKSADIMGSYALNPIDKQPFGNIKLLAKRITKELKLGNVFAVCCCKVWSSPKFVSEWVRYISEDLTTELESIICPPSTDSLNFNLIESLVCFKRENAVIRLLGNDVVVRNMQRSAFWIEGLQRVLETAVFEKQNIDLVKALVSCLSGEMQKRLNGSETLISALEKSNAECAKLLLNYTTIDPLYTDRNGRGYLHYLIRANITDDDFRILCEILFKLGTDIHHKESVYGNSPLLDLMENIKDPALCARKFMNLIENAEACGSRSDLICSVFQCFADISNHEAISRILPDFLRKLHCTKPQGNGIVHSILWQVTNSSYWTKDKDHMLMTVNIHKSSVEFLLQYLPDGDGNVKSVILGCVFLSNNVEEKLCAYCTEKKRTLSNDKDYKTNVQSLFNSSVHITVEYFQVKRCVDVRVESMENYNLVLYTLLWNRKRRDTLQLLQCLYSAEVDFHVNDKNGRNAMHYLFLLNNDCLSLKCEVAEWDSEVFTDCYYFCKGIVGAECYFKDIYNREPLMLAFSNCPNVKCVEDLIKNSNPKRTDEAGKTYFHYLTETEISVDKFERICCALLKKNLDINSKDDLGETCLSKCIDSKRLARVKLLTVMGASIDYNGFLSLINCLSDPTANTGAYTATVVVILSEGDVDVLKPDVNGVTPLMIVLQYRPVLSCLKKWLKRSQPVHKDAQGRNFFHYFTRSFSCYEKESSLLKIRDCLKYLLEEAAKSLYNGDVKEKLNYHFDGWLDTIMNGGEQKLGLPFYTLYKRSKRSVPEDILSSYTQNKQTIRDHLFCLQDYFGQPLLKNKEVQMYLRNLTPASCSTFEDTFREVCGLLCKAKIDINGKDAFGRSPLFECISVQGVKVLATHGADIHSTDACGRNLVAHNIANLKYSSNAEKLIQYLTQAGVSYLQPDNNQVTPLMLALEKWPNLSCLKDWLKVPAAVQEDKLGQNYFHYLAKSFASTSTFFEICEVLLEQGVNINWKDVYGRSPLFKCHSVQQVQTLVTHGADAHVRDTEGINLITNALERFKDTSARKTLIKYLEEVGLNKTDISLKDVVDNI